jgi:uncharacterized lipoprotein
MTAFIRSIILFACALTLAGCSYLSSPSAMQGKNSRYMQARSIPPIRIPPGIATNGFHTDYPVSDRNYPDSAKDISLVPPGLNN